MWFKWVISSYGWMNTGITASGPKPADLNGVRWCRIGDTVG
jgi:hypothetical protein